MRKLTILTVGVSALLAFSGCAKTTEEVAPESQSYEYLDFSEQSGQTPIQSGAQSEHVEAEGEDDVVLVNEQLGQGWDTDNHGDWETDEYSGPQPGDTVPEQGWAYMTPGNVALPTNGLIGNDTAPGMSQEDGAAANLTGIWFVQKTWNHKTEDTTEWQSVARAVGKNGAQSIQYLVPELNERAATRIRLWESDSGKMEPVFTSVNAVPGATPDDLRINVCYQVRYKSRPDVLAFSENACDMLTMVKEGEDWKVAGFDPDSLHMLNALASN